MKLASVEFCGFRGFKHRTRFDFPAGFVVLTGRNGVGKSTVLDAIDFAITGTINKFDVTGAKGGGLREHIWWVGEGAPEQQYVTIRFTDDSGSITEISRSRDRGLQGSLEELAERFCGEGTATQGWPATLMQTSLIRDETVAALSLDLPEQARFAAVRSAIGSLGGPDYSRRTNALLQAAADAKKEQERRLLDVQVELGRALSGLTEARSISERQPDVAEANKVISEIIPDIQGTAAERAEVVRRVVASNKQALTALTAALTRAAELNAERLHLESESAKAEADTALAALIAAQQAKSVADSVLRSAEEAGAAEREADAFVSHYVALIEHGTAVGLQDHNCPLCDSQRSQAEFDAAIAAARRRLSTRGERIARSGAALDEAKVAVQRAEDLLRKTEERVAKIEARKSSYTQALAAVSETLSRWKFDADPRDLDRAKDLMASRLSEDLRLEHALYLLEASSAHDRVSALQARVEQLRAQVDEETAKFAATERAVDATRQVENATKTIANEVLAEQFDTVLPLLKELYRRLRPHTTWREIETDFGGRVRASLNFTVGDGRNPQFLFSSGQRRAAGIAFLLAIHLSRPWCRLRSLLLDDPVQHVDDYRALNLVELLSAVRRTGRQVVIAVEDPALADLLCRRLRSTSLEPGRRFELCMATDGSATIDSQADILPLLRKTMRLAS